MINSIVLEFSLKNAVGKQKKETFVENAAPAVRQNKTRHRVKYSSNWNKFVHETGLFMLLRPIFLRISCQIVCSLFSYLLLHWRSTLALLSNQRLVNVRNYPTTSYGCLNKTVQLFITPAISSHTINYIFGILSLRIFIFSYGIFSTEFSLLWK